jgi:outer membrane biosynthesis protein TonB
MVNGLNRYLHGTVWGWKPGKDALIISGDDNNRCNPEVNCVTITATADDSVGIDNILHTQIYTVSKKELVKFKGAVHATLLAAVKAKIKKQLGMDAGETGLKDIRDTAAKLIGQLKGLDSDEMPAELEPSAAPVVAEPVPAAEEAPVVEEAKAPAPKPVKVRKPRVKKQKKAVAKKQEVVISPRTGKPKREMKSYTDEDEAFVLDENRSTKEIMEHYGLPEKRRVYDMKFALKKRRDRRQS